jgi:peptide/nickel transport system permease protein
MKNYIIKRLLLMAVTLFGISVITFVIVQAAPGDPAAARAEAAGAKQQISKRIIEDTRKLYYLDKPIIWNPTPDDRVTLVARYVARLREPLEEDRQDAAAELLESGAFAAPALLERLSHPSATPQERAEAARLLDQIHPSRKAPPALGDAALAAHWSAALLAEAPNRDETLARARAERYLAAPAADAAARAEVLASGAYAVPHLIGAARDPGHPSRDRAQAALAEIVRKTWVAADTDQARSMRASEYEARKRELAARGKEAPPLEEFIAAEREREARDHARKWREWWRDSADKFQVHDGAAAFVRKFTQTRFGRWFGLLLRGDFGESYRLKRPVVEVILERLPVSLQLSLISVFISYTIAIPLGIHSATRRGTRLDALLTVFLFILYSLPTFFVAQMLIIFTTGGDYPLIFPTRGLDSASPEDMPFGSAFLDRLWHLALPITVLTYGSFAYISRQMRAGMLETIRQDYIRTARAKGLSERKVIFKHALRNSMIPILTLLGSVLPHLLSGSVIIEQIFTINGMGKLGFESVINRDYPVIMGISFFSALLTLLGIFISDLSYALVDPRISYE